MKRKAKIAIARLMAILMVLSVLPADLLGPAGVVSAEELEEMMTASSEDAAALVSSGDETLVNTSESEAEAASLDNEAIVESENVEVLADDAASEVKVYIFDPEDFDESKELDANSKYGTDNYFTVTTKVKSAEFAGIQTSVNDVSVDAYNPIDWNGYENETVNGTVNKDRTKCISLVGGTSTNSANSIMITTTTANASLLVYSSPKNGKAAIQVLSSDGKKVLYPGKEVDNPKVAKDTIVLEEKGTYFIGPAKSSGNNGGIILYMQVTEDPNATAGDDSGSGNTGGSSTTGPKLSYDAEGPFKGVKTSGSVSFTDAEGNAVDVKNVGVEVQTLNAAPNDTIKTAVDKAKADMMASSTNKDEGAEPSVSYYDISLVNKDENANNQSLKLSEGAIKIKLPYPDGVRMGNKILVMHEAEDPVEVQRATDKDSDGFWITASSFSPYTVIIEPTAAAQAGALNVYDKSGYAEGAYAEWDPYTGTEFSGYMAWVSKDDQSWDRVDDELIRYYGDHYRVDVLGLTEGDWSLKIQAVAIAADSSAEAVAETTVEVKVTPHDRSGYAWVADKNGHKTSSGAYNENGSLIDGANVVYVTDVTKDTVTLDVTTDSKGKTTTYTGIQGILDGYKKGYESKPLDIRIIGNVTNASYLDKDDIVIENANGKNGSGGITVEGVGEDAVANGWGIRVKNASNVEIRNLAFMNRSSNGEKDNIGLQQGNDHVWVHHCDLFYGNAGSDADQIKGDGALDCKKSNYVTMSYNHFWDSGKSSLLGLSENSNDYYVTYHHNWFDHSDSRHPRIRFFTTHVYNNYYDGNAKYGVGGAKGGASIFVENNYFRNCKYPMLISMQGSDLWDESKQQNVDANGTFSKEDGSIIKAYGNIMEGEKRFIAYESTDNPATKWDETKEFDAYVAKTRDEKVPSTVKATKGGWTYSNFDTASDFYKYTPDPAEKVPEIVMNNAGRVNGGDFKWEFDNATADSSYLVDEDLKAACMNYVSKLISVGGLNGQTVSVTYTVTFDPDNGQDTWDVPVASGQKVAKPADPTSPEAGKSFVGWYKGNAVWNFDNVVNGNMVLKALYLGEGEEPPFTGGGEDDDLVDDDDDNSGGNVDPSEYIHNFTVSEKTSNFYTISGNLSKDKGKATYKELTLTQCLKMESSTSITFKAPVDGELTLVFGLEKDSAAGNDVKINGTRQKVGNDGVLTHPVEEGTVEITKGDSMHLFYMEYVPDPNAAPAEKYVITVKPDNGDKDYTINLDKGDDLTSDNLKTPIRSGYVFQGWVDANGKSITLPYTPTGNMTVKATWKAVSEGGDNTGSGDSWTVEMEENVYTYTGSAIKPDFTVYGYDGEPLVAGVDYTVKYSNNVNASVKANTSGEYVLINAKKVPTVTITGKGNLTGKRTVEFEIRPADIGDATYGKIVIETGKKISTPVLYYNNVKLAAKDYKYENEGDKKKTDFNDGDSLKLLGQGNFEGDVSIPIQVVEKGQLKNAVGKFKVTVDSAQAKTLIYTGENLKDSIIECIRVEATKNPNPEATFDSSKYVITLPDVVTEVGTVKFTVVGLDEFSGCSVTKSVKILPRTLTDSDVTVASEDAKEGVQYKSTGATLSDLTVSWQGQELTNGKDYKVTYSANKKVGDAKYTISFMGNFKGKLTAGTFKVNQAALDMTNADIDIVVPDKACKDKASCKSTPYVTINNVLVKSSEYKVTYRVGEEGDFVASPKAGEFGEAASKTVYVKIESKGKNYSTAAGQELIGEYTVWKLDNANKGKDLSKAKVTFYTKDEAGNLTKVTKLEYTGEAVEPDVVEVTFGKDTTDLADQCEIVYTNNVNKGKATVIVKPAAGSDLIGSKAASFTITAKNAGGLNATSLASLIQSLFN